LRDENLRKKPNSAKTRPEKGQTEYFKPRKKPNFVRGTAIPLSQQNIFKYKNNCNFFRNLD